ncbi:DUF305 domain-containing protein [Lentzea sp. DG1S-22]|uniref:DUF305 domain-containing protein n=1 Tax=Lentzea sp. DG1S-22 TaxID=3108822 RepID=UPI002E78C2CB|nr:DUF305 domain-containing protein [Lentzea sp. DG1S-22]WVH81768.1 DUF305 domain-containing protein [Lentzea sp. DG1S-22]
MRTERPPVVRALVVAAALVVVTGCGTSQPAPPGAPASPVAADLSATDLAFVDLVIPQNESALAALALTATRPGSALRPVADRVGEHYRAELARARELLARAGRQESGQHEGHDMPGMITAAELAAVGTADAEEFDEHLEALLRTQAEEARTVARAELTSGTSAMARELGARVDRSRAEFLALLGAP